MGWGPTKNHIRHNAMKLKNIIREATAALKRNWVRSILTILGISVGVGAFICVVAIGNAGSSSIEKQLQNLGDNFIWIEAGSRARNGVRYGARGDRTLILGDATAIVGQVPLVKSMSPNADGHTQVVYAGENWVTMFRGVTPVFLQIRRWNMKLGTFWLDDIFCSAVSREAMPEATKQIVALLRERHHLNPAEADDFNIRRPEDVVQAQLATSRILTILLGSVASLSLLVDGIGIMNIMLVSVTQRTREIGLRLAVGARESDVQLQFLSEAIALSLLGGLLGLLVGLVSSALVENVFQMPTKLSPEIFCHWWRVLSRHRNSFRLLPCP